MRLVLGLIINAISFVLITLFVKLLRVSCIFSKSSKLKSHLGKRCSNISLFIIIVLLTVILNVMLVPVLILEGSGYETYSHNSHDQNIQVHIRPYVSGSFWGIGVVILYLISFLILISYLAIRTRKIKYSNFKDTKKIHFLIAVLLIIICFTVGVVTILYHTHNEPQGNVVLILSILSVPMVCQVVLFMPKSVPVLLEKIHLANGMMKNQLLTK